MPKLTKKPVVKKKKASLADAPSQPDIVSYIKPEKGSIINAAAHIEVK